MIPDYEEPARTAHIVATLFEERYGKKPKELKVIHRKKPNPFLPGPGRSRLVQASDNKGKTLTMLVPIQPNP